MTMTLYEVVCNDTTATEVAFPPGRNHLILDNADELHWATSPAVTVGDLDMVRLPTVLDLAAPGSIWVLTDSGSRTVRFLNYPKAC